MTVTIRHRSRGADVRATEKARNQAHMLGLCEIEDVGWKIPEVIYKTARITHPAGNRRYNEWVFKVVEGQGFLKVVNIHRVTCEVCEDRKRIHVPDECNQCHGTGCKKCKGSGEISLLVPCPSCATQH